jgi:serine/threonine-protein kinase
MIAEGTTIKIVDFGAALLTNTQHTQLMDVGTPSYMSPEQIKGRPVDGRSDIFSLGGVLYELLTGSKPFPGDSITSVIYKIVSEEPAAPRDLDGSIHPGLSAIVLRALAKAPEGRFQSCVQFFDALQNYRDYKPDNYPQSAPEPAGRFVAEPQASTEELPELALVASEEPAKKGGSVLLALFLLCVIAVAGYKVWPPLKDLWLRTQPPPDLVLPPDETPMANAAAGATAPATSEAAASSTPAAPTVTQQPPTAATSTAATQTAAPPASTPAVSVTTVSQSNPRGAATPTPAVATAAARPKAAAPERPAISPRATEWRQHVVVLLADAGLADNVQVVASGSTLTLAGKLDTGTHRKVLGLLRDSPSDVQIVDHIEETAAPSPTPSGQPAPQN